MATYAIGDVQGCYDPLQRLLDLLCYDPQIDRLWFVGDLVNRGPQSLATLRFIRSLGEGAIAVLGNHDLHLLSIAAGVSRPKAGDTLEEILSAPDRDELLNWLRQRPLLHEAGEHIMVHAGVLPQWTRAQAKSLAAEVESALQSDNAARFFEAMYGDEPRQWSDTLIGSTRLRVITNALTRLRVCTAAGVMDLRYKGPADAIPAPYVPWFAVTTRRTSNDSLIVGHWSALGLRLERRLIALDSGCFWGGQLTAVRLEDRQVFQVNCR